MRIISLIFSLLLISSSSMAALSEPDKAITYIRNFLSNPGFENGKAGWTATAGTLNVSTTATHVGVGNASLYWDAAANGDTLNSSTITLPAAYSGATVEFGCKFLKESGTVKHAISLIGSTGQAVGRFDLSNNSTYTKTTGVVRLPSTFSSGSSTFTFRIHAQQNEPGINIDDCIVGTPLNGRTEIRSYGVAGFGSTNTKIPYYTSQDVLNYGNDVTADYNNSTLGASYTINTPGLYWAQICHGVTSGDSTHGISKNAGQLTTNLQSINTYDKLAQVYEGTNGGLSCVSTVTYLNKGDIIRPHTNGAASSVAETSFKIVKLSP